VVAHGLVDVEIGGRRRVESREQLVDDDEELHLPGLMDELRLHRLLELLSPGDRFLSRLVEPLREHLLVDVVLAELFRESLAGFLALDIRSVGTVRGDDRALAGQFRLSEQLVDLACLVDAARDEHGVATPAPQAVAGLHVQLDVGHDFLEPGLTGQDLAHRAPALLELGLGEVGEAAGLGFEPLVDFGLRRNLLIDVARLVAQVEDDPIAHGLVEFVGVDVGAEDLDAPLLVRAQERRAGEPDEHGIGQDRLHRVVEVAGLRAMALVDEDVDVALGAKVRRQRALEFMHVALHVGILAACELVDEGAHEPRLGGVERGDQVGAARGPIDVFADALEDFFDLLIQLDAVGDDDHARVGHVFADPLREPDHDQALARALRVPDDAAFATLHMRLRLTHGEVLIVSAQLLGARIEDDEVVDELEETLLGAELKERAIERVLLGAVLPPREVVFLLRFDGSVAQAFGVVAGHHELRRGEEVLDEDLLLVVEILPDAFGRRDDGPFQLEDAERDAVDIEHDIRALGVCPGVRGVDRDLLGDSKVIVRRMLPIDQPHRLVL